MLLVQPTIQQFLTMAFAGTCDEVRPEKKIKKIVILSFTVDVMSDANQNKTNAIVKLSINR